MESLYLFFQFTKYVLSQSIKHKMAKIVIIATSHEVRHLKVYHIRGEITGSSIVIPSGKEFSNLRVLFFIRLVINGFSCFFFQVVRRARVQEVAVLCVLRTPRMTSRLQGVAQHPPRHLAIQLIPLRSPSRSV